MIITTTEIGVYIVRVGKKTSPLNILIFFFKLQVKSAALIHNLRGITKTQNLDVKPL